MASSLPSSMKASQWTTTTGGIQQNLHSNESASLPKNAASLPKDSTLVEVAYASLNPVDYKLPEMPIVNRMMFSRPSTPCLDFAGTVISSNLPDLSPGDRVFGKSEPPVFGALGEYLVVGKQACTKLPDGVSLQHAATIGVCGLTSYQCIVPHAQSGDKVLINGGSGGTGTFGIQIAKAIGCTVTTTCSGTNVEYCKSLGADEVIDYRTTDVVSHLKRSGTQYDLIVDNVNTPAIFFNAADYLKPTGRYIVISGDVSISNFINLMKIFVLPTWLGGVPRQPKLVTCQTNPEQLALIGKWMAEGKVRTEIEQTYELAKAGEGFDRLKSGRVRGKLVVKVAGE